MIRRRGHGERALTAGRKTRSGNSFGGVWRRSRRIVGAFVSGLEYGSGVCGFCQGGIIFPAFPWRGCRCGGGASVLSHAVLPPAWIWADPGGSGWVWMHAANVHSTRRAAGPVTAHWTRVSVRHDFWLRVAGEVRAPRKALNGLPSSTCACNRRLTSTSFRPHCAFFFFLPLLFSAPLPRTRHASSCLLCYCSFIFSAHLSASCCVELVSIHIQSTLAT